MLPVMITGPATRGEAEHQLQGQALLPLLLSQARTHPALAREGIPAPEGLASLPSPTLGTVCGGVQPLAQSSEQSQKPLC